ncbi:hypothetical protein ACFOSC_10575 [Streptantibioticus rubrisoli]
MYDQGVAIQVIAERLRMDRKTVGKYAHAATVEDGPVPAAPASLAAAGMRRVPQHALAGGMY